MKKEYAKHRSDYALHYDIERLAQPGGIEIDPEERVIRPFCNTEINSIPSYVFNRRTFWFTIADTENTTIKEINDLIDELCPLAEKLCNEYKKDIENGRIVGELTEKGEEIRWQIKDICWSF